MIELIDQSALNETDRTMPVVFGWRCAECGKTFKTTSRAQAERHECALGAREAFRSAQQSAPARKPRVSRKSKALPEPIVEAPKKRDRPKKVQPTGA